MDRVVKPLINQEKAKTLEPVGVFTQAVPATQPPPVYAWKQIHRREKEFLPFEMVKAYLRYEPARSFGVIVSGDSNIAYDSSGKHLLAVALEKVGVWHVRQGVCTKTLAPTLSSSSRGGPALAVTSIASSQSSFVIFGSLPDFENLCF